MCRWPRALFCIVQLDCFCPCGHRTDCFCILCTRLYTVEGHNSDGGKDTDNDNDNQQLYYRKATWLLL